MTALKQFPRLQIVMAETFYYAGFIEAWGRGTLKIMEKCAEQGLPEPDFKEKNGVMTVTFYKDKWNEENLKKLGLNDRQIKVIVYMKEKGSITNREYQSLFSITDRTALRDLNDLISKGLVKKRGVKKGTRYLLIHVG